MTKKQANLLQSIKHLTQQKLGLNWESCAIEPDTAHPKPMARCCF